MINLVVIGGSAGSFLTLKALTGVLPETYPVPLVVVTHRMKDAKTDTATTLQYNSSLKIQDAQDKTVPAPGNMYLAPADYHLLMEKNFQLSLDCSSPVNFSRPSIDVFFESVAQSGIKGVTAILLSGANADGARGLKAIHDAGGKTIVEDPETTEFDAMPGAAINLFHPDLKLTSQQIIDFLKNITAT